MTLDVTTLEKITGAMTPSGRANAKSVLRGLEAYGYEKLGLNRPHRLAHYLAQVMHESGDFKFDKELWGPTPAQARYDTRTDLGNTPARDGDGYAKRGRGPIQITGGYNYRDFTKWARKNVHKDAPDFDKNPDLVNTDPWEGLVALWYWETRDLNVFADRNDIRGLTKRINGGYNGLSDRKTKYLRAALVLLGYSPHSVRTFQMTTGLSVDGVAGPKTMAALHQALALLPPVTGAKRPGAPSPGRSAPKPGANPFLELIRAILRALGVQK